MSHLTEKKRRLNKKVVTEISEQKNDPGWMTDFRLKALEIFERMPMPKWGVNLDGLDPYDLHCYIKPAEKSWSSWESVPEKIKQTFESLGVPQAERKFLAGVGAQYESEMVYKNLKKKWEDQGVIFTDFSTGLRDYEQLFKKCCGLVVLIVNDNLF